MSDLQLALLALGAIIIASVILFNWWQERRFSRETVRRFEGPVDDALLDEFRIDPNDVVSIETEESVYIEERFDDTDEQVIDEVPELQSSQDAMPDAFDDEEPLSFTATESIEEDQVEDLPADEFPPSLDEDNYPQQASVTPDETVAPQVADAPAAAVAMGALPAGVDQQIDLVGLVHLRSPRSGATLRQELLPLPEFDKPAQWFGQDDGGAWHYLTKDQEAGSFVRMACTLQLADRSGPVSGDTLRNFQLKVDEIATNLGATVEWQGSPDPHRYASELDQFCIEVDVMVGFHITSAGGSPFAGTKLRGLAEAGGMRLRDDGNFHYESETGETLFMMINQDQRPFTPEALRTAFVRGVTFQLDVPRVPNCAETFNQMVLLARQMENSLGGSLVDDNQRALGDADIEKIRQQLKVICARMLARGVIPGTPTALRLFS